MTAISVVLGFWSSDHRITRFRSPERSDQAEGLLAILAIGFLAPIILLARGVDTFSRKTLDEVYEKIRSAKDTVIYSIETDRNSEHRQETNQMRAFAQMRGGQFFFGSSPQESADVFRTIGQSIRNHYILTCRPTHTASDGAWHKIKVQVVTATGHKEPYQVVARDGYRAKGR